MSLLRVSVTLATVRPDSIVWMLTMQGQRRGGIAVVA